MDIDLDNDGEDKKKALLDFKQELDIGDSEQLTMQWNIDVGNGEAVMKIMQGRMQEVNLAQEI